MEELQKINRRRFIQASGVWMASFGLGSRTVEALGKGEVKQLTILHTNDVHSRVEPFSMDGTRNQGLGGVARRAALINRIRKEQKHVLLLDAGDIFQGTPYFNLFGGELEMKLMSEMGYDAATMGNHDFDNGLEGFYKQRPHADFPILVSNYDFSNTILHQSTHPYKVITKGDLRIGVFGLGIELAGLVEKKYYGETLYLDPVKKANELAARLKFDYACDLVVCLSHLGYKYTNGKISDHVLASQSHYVDLIIGGHTHTFMNKPDDVPNLERKTTTVNQVGWGGILLGRIDYFFEKGKAKKTSTNYTITDDIGK